MADSDSPRTTSGRLAAAQRAARKRRERARSAPVAPAAPAAAPSDLLERPEPPAEAEKETRGQTTEQAEEVAEVAAETATPRAPSRGRAAVCAGLAVACAVALASAGVAARDWWNARETARAATAASAAARLAAPAVLSYDYRHLNRDFATARTYITGGFRSEYARTTASVVGPTAGRYHGVVRAVVAKAPIGGAPAVSVVSATRNRVVVLLFVNQTTTSTKVAGSRVDLDRVRFTMAHTSGGWRVEAVDAL
ncbi:hypothetical protein [Phaeacidiphilus oryzae]|uniref:hypothetical protein n=1 Tax=Phaeacidiphilus oryzae TaxID=348818 RepID=UPI00056C0275|nr:hypothetical protein [Phaeacidiphilus oryzae]